MLVDGVLTLGVSVQSSPILTRRVSAVAFACQRVHVPASRSTIIYAAEKNGRPTITASLTLLPYVGAKSIPGEEESVSKAPLAATCSWGKIRISFDSVYLDVPSRTIDKSPPYLFNNLSAQYDYAYEWMNLLSIESVCKDLPWLIRSCPVIDGPGVILKAFHEWIVSEGCHTRKAKLNAR